MKKFKRFIKKYLNKFINELILYKFGYSLNHRNDSSPFQFKDIFKLKNKTLTLIDCGAFTGEFTKEFLKYFPDSYCICIEPSPNAFKKLKKAFSEKTNISLYQFGLFDKDIEKEIYINAYEPTNSIFEKSLNVTDNDADLYKETNKVSISLKKLDNIMEEYFLKKKKKFHIDFLKIDVQSAEMYLLNGAIETLKYTEYILIEIQFVSLYKNSPTFHEIYNFLEEKGFKFLRFYDLTVDETNRTKLIHGDAFFKKIK